MMSEPLVFMKGMTTRMIKAIHQTRSYPHPKDDHLELVLAEVEGATYYPYVVWMHNFRTDTMEHGDYYSTFAEAQDGFEARYQRIAKQSLRRTRRKP